MRRLIAMLVLVATSLAPSAPGLCAVAQDQDMATAHHAHGAHAHHDAHGQHAPETAEAPTTTLPDHHDGDCAIMLRCHWSAIPESAGHASVPLSVRSDDGVPLNATATTVPLSSDTPPPRTLS